MKAITINIICKVLQSFNLWKIASKQILGKEDEEKRRKKRCRRIPSPWLQKLEQQSGHGVPCLLLCAQRTNVRHDVYPLSWNTTPPLTQEVSARPWALWFRAFLFAILFYLYQSNPNFRSSFFATILFPYLRLYPFRFISIYI